MVRYLGEVPDQVLTRRPEVVTQAGHVSAWLLGSGMTDVSFMAPEYAAMFASSAPAVCDAGALDAGVLSALGRGRRLILTPHAGEAARLLGRERADVTSDPVAAARAIAEQWNATVVLKGNISTLVSADGSIAEFGPASPWLATAGTGDVLAGVIGALLSARPDADPGEVAAAGIWLHSRAAERLRGPFVTLDLATEIAATVGEVLT